MFDYFINSTNIEKALFLMLVGTVGTFTVLILYFVIIKLLIRLFPKKNNDPVSTQNDVS